VVENKPVARLLFTLTDIDEAVPENMYRALPKFWPMFTA
jgi:flagellar biosynthesis protein FlhB